MYTPKLFQSENITEAFELMDRYPFATVITVANGKPQISHLPLSPQIIDGKIELIGHLARANPHWKSFAHAQATVIFHGPHTYITPQWYTDHDVPTWNYITVHATGQIELIEDPHGITQCLQALTTHIERHWPSGWDFFIPEDLAGDVLAKAIVGFRIKVSEIQFKKKLSQNRSPADCAGVLKGLAEREDDASRAILETMRKIPHERR